MNNKTFILTLISLFVVLLSTISLAQETPNQISDEEQTIKETSNLETNEGPIFLVEINNSSGTIPNESTYYMNSRPADFIQVVNTNGTIINETYIYKTKDLNHI